METISKLERLILNTASEKIWLQETDAASANERLYNYRLAAGKNDGILREMLLCQNHQNNLAEGSLVAVAHKSLISDFFSFSHFLQAGTHFTKLKHALRQYIKEFAVIRVVEHENYSPNEDFVQFLDQLLDMHAHVQTQVSVVQDSLVSKSGMVVADAGVPMSSQLSNRLRDFREMWNQDLDMIGHVCRRAGAKDTWCCQNDDQAKGKMADSLLKLALNKMPETPAPGKWTKLWSCLQFLSYVSSQFLLLPFQHLAYVIICHVFFLC